MSFQARFCSCLVFGFILMSVPAYAQAPMTREQIFQFATLAARDGQYQQAIDLFKKVLNLDPNFPPAYNSIGLVYQAMNDGDKNIEALRYFRIAVEMDPGYLECWNNLGRAAYAQGQFAQAEKAFLTSLKLKEKQPDVEIALGWVYLIGKSLAEEAMEHFQSGLDGKDDDSAHYGLGLAYVLLNNKFKVLDQITELRRRKKEEQAAKLENMIRGNIQITSHPGSPLITGVEGEESVFDKELGSMSGRAFDRDDQAQGIQVRLSGPLE